jgi:hypothetical protein
MLMFAIPTLIWVLLAIILILVILGMVFRGRGV